MYSAKRNLGGGVVLDTIHEIDYAMWFFGEVAKISSIYGKLSSLEINTEDIAEVLLKFKKGVIANIHMDYIQRCYSRNCKIIGEEGTIFWDFNENCIKLYSARMKKWKTIYKPKNYQMNQMYIDEIKYFLDCVKKKQNTFNDVFDSLKTLKVALAVKGKRIYG
jgi:predicted dehydrogenase